MAELLLGDIRPLARPVQLYFFCEKTEPGARGTKKSGCSREVDAARPGLRPPGDDLGRIDGARR